MTPPPTATPGSPSTCLLSGATTPTPTTRRSGRCTRYQVPRSKNHITQHFSNVSILDFENLLESKPDTTQGRTQESGVHLVQANTGAPIKDTPGMVHAGINPIATLGKQLLITIGNLV